MAKKHKVTKIFLTTIFISVLILIGSYNECWASSDIKLIVDNKDITNLSGPIIVNSRTLVPIRFISEAIGAKVIWDGDNRTVLVEKENKSVFLKIDSRIINYNQGELYQFSDVAPFIINSRTYVPLRLISNALEIGIEWDNETRTVYVDSAKKSSIEPFYDFEIKSIKNKDIITSNTNIEIDIPEGFQNEAKEIKMFLIDKDTLKGFEVANSSAVDKVITYLPKIEDDGEKIIVVALYDENNEIIAGDLALVTIDAIPEVHLEGIEYNEVITDELSIKPKLNFLPTYVKYEFINTANEKIITVNERDPFDYYTWYPKPNQNGDYKIRVVAYDGNDNFYESEYYYTSVNIDSKLSLKGVYDDMTINKPVSLLASRNFDVLETQFLLIDPVTEKETLLTTIPFGSYSWFPNSEYAGKKQLLVRVKDTSGKTHDSEKVNVNIDGSPKIMLIGVGPGQVLTDDAKLSIKSNVDIDNVKYILTNNTTNQSRIIGETTEKEFVFTPLETDEGEVTIQAKAMYEDEILYSEKISLKIYLEELFGPEKVVEKDKFIETISSLAIDSKNKTDMSAALQVAQAILETGWGQSVPVDKYNGTISYNLFGIKGTGTNDFVVSNTWEVYNGVSFRTDANFRAYHNINESWLDHKNILLNLSRYEPFRKVMNDSTLGAWAIRRAGYATDPKYPIKLIKIIKEYDLLKLDEIQI